MTDRRDTVAPSPQQLTQETPQTVRDLLAARFAAQRVTAARVAADPHPQPTWTHLDQLDADELCEISDLERGERGNEYVAVTRAAISDALTAATDKARREERERFEKIIRSGVSHGAMLRLVNGDVPPDHPLRALTTPQNPGDAAPQKESTKDAL